MPETQVQLEKWCFLTTECMASPLKDSQCLYLQKTQKPSQHAEGMADLTITPGASLPLKEMVS
jgi:hypothetical protein